jgi:thymidylate synthase (FAD)
MIVKILQITPDADKLIEQIGRVCYDSERLTSATSHVRFVKNLIERGHDSVLEHGVVTFHISEISRACAQQLTRHRIASYTMRSQRYCTEDNFGYIAPDSMTEGQYIAYMTGMETARRVYQSLVKDHKMKPEDARLVLPNACHTTLSMTINFRSLRNFFKLRMDPHAQWEIRALAFEMFNLVWAKSPTCFDDFLPAYLKYMETKHA